MTEARVNGIRINYRFDGPSAAPVLVLVHALGTEMHMWDTQIEALAARFRVLRYDGRGHGASETTPGPYTIEQLGEDLIALLDHLDVQTAGICGISMGGQVSLFLAAHFPERLERAIFANTAAKIGAPDIWDTRIELVRSGGMKAASSVFVERMFSDDFRKARPEAVDKIVAAFESMTPAGYVASCYALRDADLRDAVTSIRVPSLIVAAENDVSTPPDDARWLHARVPGSELIVFEHTAHLSNVEQPDRFSDAVLDWLGRPGSVESP